VRHLVNPATAPAPTVREVVEKLADSSTTTRTVDGGAGRTPPKRAVFLQVFSAVGLNPHPATNE
jgi:hypothetical protein